MKFGGMDKSLILFQKKEVTIQWVTKQVYLSRSLTHSLARLGTLSEALSYIYTFVSFSNSYFSSGFCVIISLHFPP